MNRFIKIMLLLMTLLIAAGVFYGCGKRPEDIENDFVKMISVEEKVTPEKMVAAAEYMDQYLHKLSTEKASQMLIAYEGYISQYLNTDADQAQVQTLLAYYDEKSGRIKKEKIKKDEIAESYYKSLTSSYIYVTLKEGKIMLQPDYAAMEKEFAKNLMPVVKELYSIKTLISERPATVDATIQISYKELLDRANRVEQLIAANKGDKLILEDAKWFYSSYLNMIFLGTTNSPVFSYQTGEFSLGIKVDYQQFAAENPETSLAWAIGEYFKYLNSIGSKMDYKDVEASKAFFDNCSRIVSETEKRVYQ